MSTVDGFAPNPTGGTHSALPDPIAGFEGKGRKRDGRGKIGKGGDRRGETGNEGERQGK